MSVISSFIVPKEGLFDQIKKLYFNFYNRKVKDEASERLKLFLESLKEDLTFYVEFPYVEKYYRDSYYNFFSTKSAEYHRNCIRIAVFKGKIDSTLFRTINGHKDLQNAFRGVFNIRPTFPHIIGWALLSPGAFKQHEKSAKICSSEYKFLINGTKLLCKGFPYNSQDQEYTRCSEISVCSIIDYFSNSYQQYGIAMPSDLYRILKEHANERQIPARGLEIEDITYVLKNYGLKTIIYDVGEFKDSVQIANIIGYYVDSGIPVIIALESRLNSNQHGTFSSNHTVVACGRQELPLSSYYQYECDSSVIDVTYIDNKYIIMDDENLPYDVVTVDTSPVDKEEKGDSQGDSELDNFGNTVYREYLLKAVIVPLPEKVYLEGSKARIYVNLIMSQLGKQADDFAFGTAKPFSKLFLTTSRSYKDYINRNSNMSVDFKNLFVNLTTSKFIWVNEIFDNSGATLALMVIDATESKSDPDISDLLILAVSDKNVFYSERGISNVESVPLHSVLENYVRFNNLIDYNCGEI